MGGTDVSGSWSAAMWVNRNGNKVSSVLLDSSSYALKLEQWQNTHNVGFTAYGIGDYSFSYSAPIGIWVHLTFVGTATDTKLYVNGTLNGNVNNSISLPLGRIGQRQNGGASMNAKLDDIQLFNIALSASKVSNVYNGL